MDTYIVESYRVLARADFAGDCFSGLIVGREPEPCWQVALEAAGRLKGARLRLGNNPHSRLETVGRRNFAWQVTWDAMTLTDEDTWWKEGLNQLVGSDQRAFRSQH